MYLSARKGADGCIGQIGKVARCDGLADGFRTIAVKECIGDRVPGAVAWNLYDIDAKFSDVETVDTCVNYLNNVEGWNKVRIECRGSSIKTYLNGELRADFEDDLTPAGIIALQVHGVGKSEEKIGKQVRWRGLRIKDLSGK